MVLAASVASAQRIMVAPGRVATAPAKLATPEDFDGSFIYCRGFYTERGPGSRRDGLVDRLPGRRQQLLGAADGADADARQARRRASAQHRRRPPDRPPALPLPDPVHGRRRHAALHAPRGRRACTTTSSRAASSGSTISGDRRRGRSGSARSAACCRRPSSRSSTFRRDHPIMHTLYDVKEVPQVSSINFWSATAAARPSAAPTARTPTSAASTTSTAG